MQRIHLRRQNVFINENSANAEQQQPEWSGDQSEMTYSNKKHKIVNDIN